MDNAITVINVFYTGFKKDDLWAQLLYAYIDTL